MLLSDAYLFTDFICIGATKVGNCMCIKIVLSSATEVA